MSDESWDEFEQREEEGDWITDLRDAFAAGAATAEAVEATEDEEPEPFQWDWVYDETAWAPDDDDGWRAGDPFPVKRAHMFERFIVTHEGEDPEGNGIYAVRARAITAAWGVDETPFYNEPLLFGDVDWCRHAADAMNEAMVG